MYKKFLIFCFLLIPHISESSDPKKCDSYLDYNLTLRPNWTNTLTNLRDILKSWNPNNFSDPKMHDHHNFRYIVKMSGKIGGEFSRINVLRFKNHILHKTKMSTSLITSKAHKVFSAPIPNRMDWGFILEVPPEIIASTMLTEPDFLPGPRSILSTRSQLFEYYGIHELNTFIKEYESNIFFNRMHNEIKLMVESSSLRAEVIGLIILVPEKNEERVSDQIQLAMEFADFLELPLVKLRKN
jgi:hypothetical protein